MQLVSENSWKHEFFRTEISQKVDIVKALFEKKRQATTNTKQISIPMLLR